ncbi:uncharacterized protein LOC110099070, partial [Dendrobium catenatum]|uniref:uncharacterized protein LOC110099070 n=1 Tax=Dendrobium catenatum TaxID=906689 RepID=UPI00109F828D
MGSDCFLCWFESREARVDVLLGGPWYVARQIIGVEQWAAGLSSKSLRGFTSPVWIRLPNLPLEYWDASNLVRLAEGIGDPLLMDEQTKLLNRCAFARICVRLDLSKRLPKGVWANGLNGRFFQPIEYEGIPLICLKCGRVGHKAELCKENFVQPKQHVVKTSGEKMQDRPGVLVDAKGSGLGGLEGDVSFAGVNPAHKSCSDVDNDEGEWTIITRRRRPNNDRVGNRTQTVNAKPVVPPKAIWREVPKVQESVEQGGQVQPSIQKTEVLPLSGEMIIMQQDKGKSVLNFIGMVPSQEKQVVQNMDIPAQELSANA